MPCPYDKCNVCFGKRARPKELVGPKLQTKHQYHQFSTYAVFHWSPSQTLGVESFKIAGIDSATDLFLTLLPIRIFWTLNMSMKLKFGLGFVLGLSGIAFVASIIKTVELNAIGDCADFTFGTVDFFTRVIVEITLVDIAASVPPPPLPQMDAILHFPQSSLRPAKPYGRHTIVIVGGAHPHSHQYRSRSRRTYPGRLYDLESRLESESADNIMLVCLVEGGKMPAEGDIELGNFNRNGECGRAVVKETTYDFSYDKGSGSQSSGEDGEEARRKMWLAKDLPKIPWEG
ncbi:hypothetical protein B0J14DRAFT_631585 [Halenospora varia]|nr:hypothetical protein B0J14DRAFT_631585 [Halenospora varia]